MVKVALTGSRVQVEATAQRVRDQSPVELDDVAEIIVG